MTDIYAGVFSLGLSTCGKVLDEELFKAYKENGIEAMELSHSVWDYNSMDFGLLKALSEKHGVKLWSLHLPFEPFEQLDISVPELAEHTVKYHMDLIKRAQAAGIKTFILHSSGEPIEDSDRPMRMETALRSLKTLGEFSAETGVVIAVEDLPRTCLGRDSDEMLTLLSAHPALRSCFDTNHLLSEDISHYISALGDKIITTHVSDYDFTNERHWLPGEGMIDWKNLTDSLKSVGYKGYLLYELEFKSTRNITRSRDLNCADFKANFQSLVSGVKPSRIC